MVAARKLELELQRQLIEVLLLHKFEGAYPDVPISPDIDFEGLVQPDREAGEEPFFITLLLGYDSQVSRNQRRYVGDVAPKAIYNAINSRRITGQLGHTAEDRQAWEFKIPCLHWVGALIDAKGQVWGKAYVPRTAMELREYYRIQARTNATVGTSLSGMGYQEWNDELEMWDILELEVHRIDVVAAEGVGILKAGSMTPKITSETHNPIQEAAPDEVVGDLVSWDNRNNQLMRGRINTIWAEGEIEVPYSDSPAIAATAETPLARMDVYEPHYKTGEWRLTGWQEIQYVRDLNKIVALPELQQSDEPVLSEGQADNDSNVSTIEGAIPMADKPATPTAEERIAELQQSQEAKLTEVQAQLLEAQTKARNAEATLINLRKAIGVAEGADAVETAQALVSERDGLRTENAALLETAIERAVEANAKIIGEALQSESEDVKAFAETVRAMIRTQVQTESISRKSEIEPKVLKVVEATNIQSMLKALRTAAMGPNLTNPLEKSDKSDTAMEAVTY
jgi:hypothetical protein